MARANHTSNLLGRLGPRLFTAGLALLASIVGSDADDTDLNQGLREPYPDQSSNRQFIGGERIQTQFNVLEMVVQYIRSSMALLRPLRTQNAKSESTPWSRPTLAPFLLQLQLRRVSSSMCHPILFELLLFHSRLTPI